VRYHEDDVQTLITKDLNDFKEFCHYSSLSDWKVHKETILSWTKEGQVYSFTGNDVQYYVIPIYT